MADYIKLGMMKAEFEAACRRIDQQADEATRSSLQGAYKALLNGDTAERDRLCDRGNRALDAKRKAKIEAWLRIGEKHGIDRDDALAAWQRLYH